MVRSRCHVARVTCAGRVGRRGRVSGWHAASGGARQHASAGRRAAAQPRGCAGIPRGWPGGDVNHGTRSRRGCGNPANADWPPARLARRWRQCSIASQRRVPGTRQPRRLLPCALLLRQRGLQRGSRRGSPLRCRMRGAVWFCDSRLPEAQTAASRSMAALRAGACGCPSGRMGNQGSRRARPPCCCCSVAAACRGQQTASGRQSARLGWGAVITGRDAPVMRVHSAADRVSKRMVRLIAATPLSPGS